MATTVRDDRLSRSVMLLCVGASLLLLGLQWRAWAAKPHSPALLQKVETVLLKKKSSDPIKPTSAPPAAPQNVASLVVDLSDRRVYVYRAHKLVKSYPVAIGQAGWETPSGSFRILEMQRNPKWRHPITGEVFPAGPENPLGKRWIGFLVEGRTHVGFHGTNQEDLIGQAVSHGCIRMRNQDVIALYDQVTQGSLVDVRL